MFFFVCLFSCKNKQDDNAQSIKVSTENTSNAAVVISMEGETFKIQQEDLQPINMDFQTNKLQYIVWQDGYPLQTNVNFSDAILKENGTATYKIPEDNSPNIKIDLNFFNEDRDASRMNKRIVFRKGIINIKKLNEHALIMTFDGEGGGMREREVSFPIKGSININY
jgi:hypothetical protein